MNNRRHLPTTAAVFFIFALLLSSCGTEGESIEAVSNPTSEPEASPIVEPTEIAARGESPSVIFYGGEILTMDNDQPFVEAMAILDNKIIAVGSNDLILDMQSTDTILVDIAGLTIMPGFVDAHSHLFNAAGAWGLDFEGAQQMALEYGITSVANMYATQDFLNEMSSFSDSGNLKIRTSLYLTYNSNCGELMGDWYQDYPVTRTPGEMLRIGGVKLFTDGGSCGAPAVSFDHPAYGFGSLWFTQDELNSAITEIHENGFQAAIHALGDRAVEQALNAVEFALNGKENTARHRIEHNALVRDDLVGRYGEVGVIPLIFGSYPVCNSPFPPPPADQDGWEWRWRDLVDANLGLPFAWHSDTHVPIFGQISPLQHLFSMVTPFEVSNDGSTVCETAAWVAEKTLSVEEALPMMTINSAYALFRDEEVGSLQPGKFADLIVLSGNPIRVEPEEIIDLQILMTMVGGQAEHCTEGYETLCPEIDSLATQQNGHAWEFDSGQDLIGWEDSNDLEELVVDQGNLLLISNGTDPYISLPAGLSIDTETTPQIEIRMKVAAGFTGQVFFLPEDAVDFVEANSLRFDLIADYQFHIYTLDMSNVDTWQGRVIRLRLDPTDAITSIEIDYIRIDSGP